ncbi:hypothetical protein K2X05_10585, partial [bacterium]|nr:hypothetical protein [bacterium]
MASVLFIILMSMYSRAENAIASKQDKNTTNDNFGSLSIGHNLSTNNQTLRKNQWTIGTLYAAYGVTDEWSVGTSVFVLMDFKMFNLMTRYAVPISSKEKIGVDFAYFKTYGGKAVPTNLCDAWQVGADGSQTCVSKIQRGEYYTGFLMEAVNAKFTYSNQIFSRYRFNTTLSYFYYFDDRAPFSFR